MDGSVDKRVCVLYTCGDWGCLRRWLEMSWLVEGTSNHLGRQDST